jgi:copper(I)-binding protein
VIRVSFGKPAARRLLVGAGALALLVATAGCEAGENAPTLEFHPASAGGQTVINGIKVTDAFVLGAPDGSTVPSGGSASLFLSLYNSTANGDSLTGISAPHYASSVSLSRGAVALPGYTVANLMGPEPDVVLKDLTQPLTGGTDISVTLDFAHAGSVTLQVPVEAQSFYWGTYSPPPSPAATATASPKAAAPTPSVGTTNIPASPTGTASPTS